MAGLKAIRRRIVSVRNTRQITRAMKLVSAAKLRRAQDDVVAIRNYNKRLAAVLGTLGEGLPKDFTHPLLQAKQDDDRVEAAPLTGVVVSADRGLCGPYNANVVKFAFAELAASPAARVLSIGRRAVSTFAKSERQIAAAYEGLGDQSSSWPIASGAELLMRDFAEGRSSGVMIYYTKFVSALTQRPTVTQLLPLDFKELAGGSGDQAADGWRVKFDSPPEEIFARLLPVYVRSKLLEVLLESKASEHAARMTAMDSATRNADELIDKLQLFYNRARQSAITRDLIDIVSGAEVQV